jgi:translation initiation factor IF-2
MAEIRLSKLTKQYSVGLARLVDFLNSIGANVEMNPNAKVSDEYIPQVDAMFGEYLKLKKDSEKVTIKLKEILEMGSAQIKEKANSIFDIEEIAQGSAMTPGSSQHV